MGKGYNNYMCKKPFHPGSKANIKRAWMAEQKTENDKKKQDELKVQYEKEQDLYKNRALISSESKDKLELNFMYEAPPGAKRERQKEDDEPEYKFEWQRKYNAPREDYAKGNADIKDQPFGIPVRNVRCIKCHKWGHINTDKECPLFSQASTSSMPTTSMDPMELMRQMREDGYGLKENVLGHHLNPKAANQQLIPSDESDPEAEFLKSLSTAEKKKLLRKLKKLSKKQEKMARSKKKKSKKTKKSKSNDSSDSDSEDKKKHKKKKQRESSSSSSESSSSNEDREPATSKQKPSDTNISSKDDKKKGGSKTNVINSSCERNSHFRESKKSEYTDREKPRGDNYKLHKEKKDSRLKCDIKDVKKVKSESVRPKDLEESKADVKTNWKLNYSSSSTEDDELVVKNQKSPKEKKAKKHKAEISLSEESVKKIKTEKPDTESSKTEQESVTIDHPDGFSHSCPQAIIGANYVKDQEEYVGKRHDRFRDLHRDDRSPSIKQKYNR